MAVGHRELPLCLSILFCAIYWRHNGRERGPFRRNLLINTIAGWGSDFSIDRKPTFDLKVRSERLAAAAAIFRMSGLLLDFMMSGRKNNKLRENHRHIHIYVFKKKKTTRMCKKFGCSQYWSNYENIAWFKTCKNLYLSINNIFSFTMALYASYIARNVNWFLPRAPKTKTDIATFLMFSGKQSPAAIKGAL